jgi:hypothetical protein
MAAFAILSPMALDEFTRKQVETVSSGDKVPEFSGIKVPLS